MSRFIKMRVILSLLLSTAVAAFASEDSNSQTRSLSSIDYQLLLAGGSLKTCSTLSVKNCKDIKRVMRDAQLSDNEIGRAHV